MTVRSHKLELVVSPTSNSRAESIGRISALLRGADAFIPKEILKVVRATLFAANRRYRFPSQDIDDIVQDCLAKVFQENGKYETHQPAYFAAIVRNTVADYFRTLLKQLVQYEGDVADLTGMEIEFYEDTLSRHYSKKQLLDMVLSLADEEAAVVLLKIYEGYTCRELAIRLGTSPATVKRRFRNALINLKRKLQPNVVSMHQVK